MKNINIVSWNVNGLKAIERKKAFKWMDDRNIDFLFLQETKLSDTQYDVSKINLDKYSYISNNYSQVSKGFSGTLSCATIKPDSDSTCPCIDSKNDGRILKYTYKNLVIFNVYFPNGKLNAEKLNYKLKFYTDFFNYCMELREENYSIIICGDFNTAHTDLDLKPGKIHSNSGFSEPEREHLNVFFQNGFIDTFRYINGDIEKAYTLFPYRSKAREKNEGWRIDYILISEDLKLKLKDAFILKEVVGSDHCPIGIEIDLSEHI